MSFPSCANLYPQCLIHSWDSSTMTSFFLFEFSYAKIYFSIVCELQEALLMQLPKGNPLIKLKRRILRIPWFHSPFYRYEKPRSQVIAIGKTIHPFIIIECLAFQVPFLLLGYLALVLQALSFCLSQFLELLTLFSKKNQSNYLHRTGDL